MSHFDSNFGISCPEETDLAISRFLSTNSFRSLGHQLHVSFHNFCVTGEVREAGVTSVVMRSLSSGSSMTSITGCSEIGPSAQSIVSKYSTASKFGFAGSLNLRICPLGSAALTFITRRKPSSRNVWSMVRNHDHWPGTDSPESEVLVSVNDEINNLLILCAEAS